MPNAKERDLNIDKVSKLNQNTMSSNPLDIMLMQMGNMAHLIGEAAFSGDDGRDFEEPTDARNWTWRDR